MVDQTKMTGRTNGRGTDRHPSASGSTRSAARNMAHLLHDAVTLCQLQLRLLALDCQQLRSKLGISLAALAIGTILALSCVPVALAGIALLFRDVAGFTRLEAVWSTFALTLVVGAVCIGCGVWWLRNVSNVFEASRVEWTQNIERLKEMLRRSSHPTQSLRGGAEPMTSAAHFD
jgi:hypothetical protein